MMPATRILRCCRAAAVRLGLLAILAGCAASPPAKFYTLAPRPAATPVERFSGTVGIKSVALPKYLDRPQIVRFRDPYELSESDYERWAENLDDIVTRVLIADLAVRLPRGHVIPSSGPLTMPADATVEVDIRRFDAEPGRSVVLTAHWIVRRERNERKPVRLRSEEIRVTASSDSTPDLIAAMSDALGQLADRIAVSIAE